MYEGYPGYDPEASGSRAPERFDAPSPEKKDGKAKKKTGFETLPGLREIVEKEIKKPEADTKDPVEDTEGLIAARITLEPEEKQVVVRELAAEIAGEQVGEVEGSIEDAISAAYFADVAERLGDGEVPADEVFEASEQHVVAALESAIEATEQDVFDDDALSAIPPIRPTPPPRSPQTPPPGGGASGHSSTPSTPSPSHQANHASGTYHGGTSPGSYPGTASRAAPNTVSKSGSERFNNGADLLIGGVVGYLVGRRRGRIKTERRLLPVQEKLQEEVAGLRRTVVRKDAQLRQLTNEKIQAIPETRRALVLERLKETVQPKTEASTYTKRREGIVEVPQLRAGRERLGRVVVGAGLETIREARPGPLRQQEILEIAEKIQINGVSVRRMYEVGRLDAIGVRRVVESYARGDHYEQLFARELKGKEMEFETAAERAWKQQNQSGASVSGVSPIVGSEDAVHASAAKRVTKKLPSVIQRLPEPVQRAYTQHQVGFAGATIVTIFVLILLVLLLG